MSADDRGLLQRLRAGDPAARQELFQRCQQRLRPYFYRRLPNPSDIEDRVSEVVTKALEGIRDGLQPKVLDAWIMGIAANVTKGRYEQAKRGGAEVPADLATRVTDLPLTLEPAEDADEDLPEQPTDLEFLMGKRELWAMLRAAIDGISPKLQPIMRAHIDLSLRADHQVIGGELAAALGMSAGYRWEQRQRQH